MTPGLIRNIFLTLFVIIAVSLVITPFLEPCGSLRALDGTPGVMDHWNIWTSMNGFGGSVYALGDLLCHQMESRSFMLNGSQMAFCVRDVSVIAGMTAGLALTFIIDSKYVKDKRAWYATAVLMIPTVIDWAVQYATGFESLLTTSVTGIMLGLAVALVFWKLVLRMFDEVFGEMTS